MRGRAGNLVRGESGTRYRGLTQKMFARDPIAGAIRTGYVAKGSCEGKKQAIDNGLLSTS